MTTDAFTTAARAEAEQEHSDDDYEGSGKAERYAFIAGWKAARDHLARQEVTDAEVLAALNAQGVIVSPKMHPAPSLDYWGERATEAMRSALTAARSARGGA